MDIADREKFVFCGIRNPWDFYVSAFLHSKENETPPINYFKSLPDLFAQTYGNKDPIEGFQIWLKYVLSGAVCDRNSMVLPTRFINKPGRHVIWLNKLDRIVNQKPFEEVGMMSCWLFGVVVPGYRRMRIKSAEEFERKFKEEKLVDYYYKMETLTEDVRFLLAEKLDSPPGWEEKFEKWSRKKSNTSSREKKYQLYYTQELAGLVAEKDALIVKEFGYEF